MSARLNFRRYDRSGWQHRHDDVQVVLPVRGALDIDVAGRGGRVESARIVVIAPGTGHDQGADGDNRFLLLNCPLALFGEGRMEQLRQRPFLPAAPRLRRLAAYLDRRCPDREAVPQVLLTHCLPGLLAGLHADPAPLQRLQHLCDTLEARAGEDWTVERMAAHAGLRPSRLHALFRQTYDHSPRQWLAVLRLRRACRQLAEGRLSIARIAQDNGWSDQTSLTRSLRKACGQTPAAYRHAHGV